MHISLMVLVCYQVPYMRFSLGRILPPVFSLHSQAGLLWASTWSRWALRYWALTISGQEFPSCSRSSRLDGSPHAAIPHIVAPRLGRGHFRDGLFRFRSQLLTESQLISCTPLTYMLKFRGLAGEVQRDTSLVSKLSYISRLCNATLSPRGRKAFSWLCNGAIKGSESCRESPLPASSRSGRLHASTEIPALRLAPRAHERTFAMPEGPPNQSVPSTSFPIEKEVQVPETSR